MTMVVRKAYRAFLSPNPLGSQDKFAHAVSNLLSLNSLTAPAIELQGGEVEAVLNGKTLMAVAGDAEVIADGRRVEPWAAFFAREGVRIRSGATAYLSVRGLSAAASGKLPVREGDAFSVQGLNGIADSDLRALRVPHTLRVANGDWLESVARVQRHIGMVLEAVRRGAEQVRVRLNGGEFEVWVLELF